MSSDSHLWVWGVCFGSIFFIPPIYTLPNGNQTTLFGFSDGHYEEAIWEEHGEQTSRGGEVGLGCTLTKFEQKSEIDVFGYY